jgi:hypothetical protein
MPCFPMLAASSSRDPLSKAFRGFVGEGAMESTWIARVFKASSVA